MGRAVKIEFWNGYPKRIIAGFTSNKEENIRRVFVMNESYKKLIEPQVKNKNLNPFDFDAPTLDRSFCHMDYWIPDDVMVKSNNEVIEYINSLGGEQIFASDQMDNVY